jgi:hypothetical protein
MSYAAHNGTEKLVLFLPNSPTFLNSQSLQICWCFTIRHPRWYVHAKVYFTVINCIVTTHTFTYDMQSGCRFPLKEPSSGHDRKLWKLKTPFILEEEKLPLPQLHILIQLYITYDI